MKKEILKLKFNKETVANLNSESMSELKGAKKLINPCSDEETGCSGHPCYHKLSYPCSAVCLEYTEFHCK